jgi:hypothetical protein
MLLFEPFMISSRLCPAVKIGNATLSLIAREPMEDGRSRAVFTLDTPNFTYTDDQLRSGFGGFRGTVEIFETFMSFMSACAEAYPDGENADLFPTHVAEWLSEHQSELEAAHCWLCDEDGRPDESLIKL